jgi:hypothetical protein
MSDLFVFYVWLPHRLFFCYYEDVRNVGSRKPRHEWEKRATTGVIIGSFAGNTLINHPGCEWRKRPQLQHAPAIAEANNARRRYLPIQQQALFVIILGFASAFPYHEIGLELGRTDALVCHCPGACIFSSGTGAVLTCI